MSSAVVYPEVNIFFFQIAFIPCQNIQNWPYTKHLNTGGQWCFCSEWEIGQRPVYSFTSVDQVLWSLIGSSIWEIGERPVYQALWSLIGWMVELGMQLASRGHFNFIDNMIIWFGVWSGLEIELHVILEWKQCGLRARNILFQMK